MFVKKNGKNVTFYWTGSKKVCILNALFALIVSTHLMAADPSSSIQEGKTKIRATVVVKESRVLNKLSKVEDELEEIRKERIALEGRRQDLEMEKAQLRKELFENLKRYKLQEDKYRRLQLGIAEMVSVSGKAIAKPREEKLYGALRKLSNDCEILTLAVNEYCDYMEEALKKLKISKLEKARISYRLEGLKKKASMLNTVAEQHSRNKPANRCRVLAINDKLRVVILSAGSVQGVRNGLSWFGGKENKCRLQVVAVRPLICAAIVADGNLKELAPGTKLYTGSEKKNN